MTDEPQIVSPSREATLGEILGKLVDQVVADALTTWGERQAGVEGGRIAGAVGIVALGLARASFARGMRYVGGTAQRTRRSGKPPNFDALYLNYRRAKGAIDPCVIEALCALTDDYAQRPLDDFFQATGQLLERLTAAECIELRDLLTKITGASSAAADMLVLDVRFPKAEKAKYIDEATLTDYTRRIVALEWYTGSPPTKQTAEWPATSDLANGLFRKLKTLWLATDNLGGFWDVRTGPQVVAMRRDLVVRLLAYVELCC